MHVDFEVQRVSSLKSIPADELFQLWVEAALAGHDGVLSLAIRIVDEVEAQRFNLQYRNKAKATNILSFPSELPAGLAEEIVQRQLGDLLICAPVVKREAAEQQRSEDDHWAHLVIHGVLHLLGYDHEKSDAALVMESLETKILAKLGIADPYQWVA